MSTNTKRLNLVQPSVDDDIQQTITALSNNFKTLDDNHDLTITNIETFLTNGELYNSGKKFWNRTPSNGGNSGWINIRSGVFSSKWKKQTVYNTGDKVMSEINNGHYYECIASGTSGVTEPAFPLTGGETVYDLFGFVMWTGSYNYSLGDIVVSTVGDKSYYYKCIIAGTSGANEPSWRNISGSTIIDGGCQWLAYKTVIWQEKGISCEFIPFGSIGDYTGTNTISTVGTITTGKWQADSVPVDHGGTGAETAKDARTNLGATGKYAETIGDSTKRSFTINHNLNTQDVVVMVRETSVQGNVIETQVKVPDANNIIVEFTIAPSRNQYKVIIIG